MAPLNEREVLRRQLCATVVLRFERTGSITVKVSTMAARPFTGRPSESSRFSRYDSGPSAVGTREEDRR